MATPSVRRRGRDRKRRVKRGAPAAALAALVVALSMASCGDEPSGIAGARAILRDDARFSTAEESAEAFAEAAELLLDEGRSCDERCRPLLESSAFLQVVAVDSLQCRLPTIDTSRAMLVDHLASVQEAVDGGAPAPDVPSLPDC